jgi:hypothetical protein
MSNAPETRPQQKFPRFSPTLIGAGVLVMALGFGLPMVTSRLGDEPLPSPAQPPGAKQPGAPAPIQPPSATGLGASLLRLVIGLAVVCGLCVLLARWFGQKPPATPGAMEVVASIPVARCVLHLVRAGDRRLLVGTDLGGVKAILELPGPAPELPPPPEGTSSDTAAPSDNASPLRAPVPAAPATREEILKLLLQLRSRSDAPPPG